jgi:hypothetical protein
VETRENPQFVQFDCPRQLTSVTRDVVRNTSW